MNRLGGNNNERGAANPFLIGMILFAVLAVGVGVAFFWSFSQMNDYKNNSDEKVAAAVKVAKEEQKKADDKQFTEDYKKPFAVYQSSADFGSISFEYPKTWSQYIAENDDKLSVYFYPKAVPKVDSKTPFALRITEASKSYEDTLKSYNSKVKDGTLSATTLTIGKTESFSGFEGMRIDGQFDKTINGSVVIFKIRDKTLQIFVDSQDFMADFNNTILPSLKFEP